MATIIYTRTDEAPLLATYSLKPIIEAYAKVAGVDVETRDISLEHRLLAEFGLADDDLAYLGKLTQDPDANIIKLPNISASVPQLKAAVAELQAAGHNVPDYPDDPQTDEEKAIRAHFDAVKGSAVNPVLREGNSDRRAAVSVKNFAKKHPHSMGAWSKDSKTNVATMTAGDFRHNEQSVISEKEDTFSIVLKTADGEQVLKEIPVLAGEVVDGTFMSAKALDEFLAAQIKRAADEGILFSVHLKATMMKVSDPIIFGHVVRTYFKDVYDKYGEELLAAGLDGENGLGSVLSGLGELPHGDEIKAAIDAVLVAKPDIAMVNSDKGITNLHVPSDVIIDASMPAMIRQSGHMWDKNGEERDVLAVIPDSSYAGIYQATIDNVKANGAFDPATLGTVPNVGLMAKKAEEYGSHDKTFKIAADGTVEVRNSAGDVLMSFDVEKGDIYRSCQAKDAPIRDWVHLAVTRAKDSGMPAIFWLDPERAHDRNIQTLVEKYLAEEDTAGLDITIADPVTAAKTSVERMRDGKDTISVTGNVLRDYNTDLFPIMELGTSAKMLSIVPLMQGGGLFETGAGGSAPKHMQQVMDENHLRWDSLGEFMALAESFKKAGAPVLAEALENATETLLNEGKSPSRKVNENDNRGSHYWLARYWAEELATTEFADTFAPVAKALAEAEGEITQQLIDVQGSPADIGGHYVVDEEKVTKVMRPSQKFNEIIDAI
ncbi:MAG: NADP-dependent isocitrate dehydrogenase [Corynebacterium sp.]|nr:NADP-dependent isocitrate dehydrogenase [Corynebacterium sp.]